MRTGRELGIVLRIAIIVAALGITAAVATGVVVLPSHANDHAKTSTSDVITGQPTDTPSATVTPTATGTPSAAPTEAGTPAPQASFGQCVAANAKTASENGGQGWNPTQGCTNANAHGGNPNAADNASLGADNAGTHH
jgi:hypothetical protein